MKSPLDREVKDYTEWDAPTNTIEEGISNCRHCRQCKIEKRGRTYDNGCLPKVQFPGCHPLGGRTLLGKEWRRCQHLIGGFKKARVTCVKAMVEVRRGRSNGENIRGIE